MYPIKVKTRLKQADDADLLIVQTAIQAAKSNTTVLVGDDTDLLARPSCALMLPWRGGRQ